MKKDPQKSLDDHLVQIHRELSKVNMAVNDSRWSSALAGLDHIVEHANDAFDLIGKKENAPSSKD